MPSRREFLATAALTTLALAQETKIQDGKRAQTMTAAAPGKRPVIICAHNGFNYLDDGFAILRNGGDTLDAVLRVVRGPEDDPNDHSVGLGGLPNEDGVVELDSCCMHGPTRRAGAVGAVRDIKNVSLLARAVMDHTGHVMLVGEGATKFALTAGFPKENLLTDYSRKVWFLWKETMSNRDWWGPGITDPNWKPPLQVPPLLEKIPGSDNKQSEYEDYKEMRRRLAAQLEVRAASLGIPPDLRHDAVRFVLSPPTGTIHCSAANEKGETSGCTTTAGLAFKLTGRVGDSPIIGAGCYTDQDVGSAGATGSGEENIKVTGAHTIIENMRHGMSPHDAGMDALRRIARNYNGDMTRLRFIDMVYYILRNDGAYAGVSLWTGYDDVRKPHYICIHDGTKRREPCTPLFQGWSLSAVPTPKLQ